VAGSTCWFLEAAPVSVRFRAAEAESGSAAALACLAEAHLLAPVAGSPWQAVDSRERADGRADSHEPEVDSRERAADFRAWAAALADSAVVHSHAPEADSLGWADEPEAELLVPAADSLARVAALADSAALHSHAPEADSLAPADEPGVELLVPAADFRARVAALADSAVVHSHAPEADSRELAALSGSPELARSRAMAVDCRVPLVSQLELRSACWAAPLAAFLLRVAVADSRAALRLCWPVGLERASHSA
jgi:hypothetical protein